MKLYFVNGLEKRDTYVKFIEYITTVSDAFSVVYFQYKESEKLSKTARQIKDQLKKYKIYSVCTDKMPSLITKDDRHRYIYTLYKCDPDVIPILLSVDNLFEWDYSKYPMDLCFFRKGRSFFTSCAHAHYAEIALEDPDIKYAIEQMGIKLDYQNDVSENELYFDKKAFDNAGCTDDNDDDFSVSESIPDEYENCIGVTKDFYIIADDKRLYTVRIKDGQSTNIASSKSISIPDRVLFRGHTLYAALRGDEIGEFFNGIKNEFTDGVWCIDFDKSFVRLLTKGQFDFIMDDDVNIYVSNSSKTLKINLETYTVEDYNFSN